MSRAPFVFAIRANEPEANYRVENEDAYRREVERLFQQMGSLISQLEARITAIEEQLSGP